MTGTKPVSKAIRDTIVERQPFEEAIRKLLKAPPQPKTAISAKIKREHRVTKTILEK